MNWQEFEDQLKAGMQHHESPVDTEQLWANIHGKKKRRRLLWFWWLLGGTTMAVLGIANALYLRKTPEIVQYNNNSTTTESRQQDSKDNHPNTTRPQYANQNNQSVDQTTIATTPKTITQPISNHRSTQPKSGINTKKAPVFLPESGISPLPAQIISGLSPSAGIADNPPVTSVVYNPASVLVSPSVPVLTNLLREAASPDIPQNSYAGPLDMLLCPISNLPVRQSKPVMPFFEPRHSASSSAARTMGIYTGAMAWTRLGGVPDSLPRTGERTLEAVSLGLIYRQPLGGRWHIAGGLEYQRMNSVFNWKKITRYDSTPIVVPRHYVDGTQDSIIVWGSLKKTRTVKHYNHISTLNIPLEIAYTYRAPRWSFSPFAGGVLHLTQQASGVILDQNNLPSESHYPAIYRKNIGFSVQAGIRFGMKLNPKTTLELSPVVRYDCANRLHSSVGGNERWLMGGLQLGIVRRW